MQLSELEHHEKVALLALLGLMARLDGQVSGDELEVLRRVVSELDPDAFSRASAEARNLPSSEAILQAAGEVTRTEAREIIYELLFEMAMEESIVERERELLDWLTKAWQLPGREGASDA